MKVGRNDSGISFTFPATEDDDYEDEVEMCSFSCSDCFFVSGGALPAARRGKTATGLVHICDWLGAKKAYLLRHFILQMTICQGKLHESMGRILLDQSYGHRKSKQF